MHGDHPGALALSVDVDSSGNATATLTNDAQGVAYTINWGDGSAAVPFTPPATTGTYATNGIFLVTVTGDDGTSTTAIAMFGTPATQAIAGDPGAWGTWSPAGSAIPRTLAALQASGITASPSTLWTPGQAVQTGDYQPAFWTGDRWAWGRSWPVITAPASGATVAQPFTVSGQAWPGAGWVTVNTRVPGASQAAGLGGAMADAAGAFTFEATTTAVTLQPGPYELLTAGSGWIGSDAPTIPITVVAP